MQGRVTSTISAILVDDEEPACDELAYLLREYPDVEVVATAKNGIEALELIDEHEPELVFLDVEMPGLDGLSVIRKFREEHGDNTLPYFVMSTAYDQYALEAFRLETLDYILKPVERERLEVSLDRARRYVQDHEKGAGGALSEKARPVEQPQTKSTLQRTKLLVKSNNRNLIVDANDVIYATIDDGLITIVTTNFEGNSNYRTIEELQSNLDPEVFWRVHRSYLVNINRIREVIPWFKSSYQLRMDDKKGSEIPVSRVQTKRLRTLLKL